MWYQPCCSLSEVFGRKTEVLDILFVLILKKFWALTLEVGENKWRLYEKWVIWPLSALQGQRRRYLVPEIRATVTRTQVMCIGGSRSLSHCVLPCWGLPGPRASGASEPSPPVSRPGLRTRPQRVPLHGPTMGASVPSHFRGSQCLETERQTTCRAVREGEGLIFTNRKASSWRLPKLVLSWEQGGTIFFFPPKMSTNF